MPSSRVISTIMATAMLTAATLTSYALWQVHSPHRKNQHLRQKLPENLDTWRMPGESEEAEEQIWIDLEEVFHKAGFTLWPHAFGPVLRTPGNTYPLSSGYGYATPARTNYDQTQSGAVGRLRRFDYINPLQRAARTQDGHDVIIRVIVVQTEGHDHLTVLRRLATGENSLLSNNHTLPMFAEFQFEDIIFGVFPKVGGTISEAYGFWARNSAGDIVEMLMQMLEALAFIHSLNIAHRDAFRDNFVIQWHPESLLTMEISPSRPRVYLIDFEVAIQFPSECLAEERVTTGYPLGGSFTELKTYARPHAPECATGNPYSPFKLDVWQLGVSFSDFKSTIAEIDDVLVSMTVADPTHRLDAKGALDQLRKVVLSMPPESLLFKPWMEKDFLEILAI
ncbi:kinase-like domain-containing protein [Flammula alnicola]|nr:kinase-like domain-containing protein [Flammula alnicola]